MRMTHNEAIRILMTGDETKAWEVAQQDEGLSPNVTKAAWLAFAYQCIANRSEMND